MSGHDVVFYVFSLAAVAAALGSALRADLSKAGKAALAEGAALAGLLGLASATAAAALAGLCVVLGYAAMRRGQEGAGKLASDREPALDDAATLASRLRTAALVASFFVIAARSVLIVSWPFAAVPARAAATAVPPVALAHFLVVSLLVLSIGFFAAISRRTVAGVGLGLASASGGVVLALASASRFIGGSSGGSSGEAAQLAAIVVVFAAGAATIAVRAAGSADLLRSSDTAWNVAGSLSAVLAGVTLALLATAW